MYCSSYDLSGFSHPCHMGHPTPGESNTSGLQGHCTHVYMPTHRHSYTQLKISNNKNQETQGANATFFLPFLLAAFYRHSTAREFTFYQIRIQHLRLFKLEDGVLTVSCSEVQVCQAPKQVHIVSQ